MSFFKRYILNKNKNISKDIINSKETILSKGMHIRKTFMRLMGEIFCTQGLLDERTLLLTFVIIGNTLHHDIKHIKLS